MDAMACIKMGSVKKTMETLMSQTTPWSCSDECNPDQSGHAKEVMNESQCPWVVHGACCFTTQAPNESGSAPAQFCMPTFKIHVDLAANVEFVKEHLKDVKNAKFQFCNNFDAHLGSFVSKQLKTMSAKTPKGPRSK